MQRTLGVQRRPPCSKCRGSCYDPAFHCGLMLTRVFRKAVRLRCTLRIKLVDPFQICFRGSIVYEGRDILAAAAGRYNVLGAGHKNPCSHKRYHVANVVPKVQQGFHLMWVPRVSVTPDNESASFLPPSSETV